MTEPTRSAFATKASEAALYPVVFGFVSGFGRCVGVDLASAHDAEAAALPPLLHPEEGLLCGTMRGVRLVEFVGGRIAARQAREGLGGGDEPTLAGAGGMPTTTQGVSVSISHSRRLAVALACAEAGGSVGVDVEPLDSDGNMELLAERILSDEEQVGADSNDRPIGLLRRLSLKEAAYKALFPRYGHIPLRQISVLPSAGQRSGFRVFASGQRIPVSVASRALDGQVLSLGRLVSGAGQCRP